MSAAGDNLRRLADKADNEGGRAAAQAMAETARDDIKQKLGQRSHAPGTPTPSPPGTPPAKISGALQGSITTDGPQGGGGEWVAYVGPRGIVYAAIQLHGGQAGRNHASDLPPRPYMPADSVRVGQAGAAAFYRVMFGG